MFRGPAKKGLQCDICLEHRKKLLSNRHVSEKLKATLYALRNDTLLRSGEKKWLRGAAPRCSPRLGVQSDLRLWYLLLCACAQSSFPVSSRETAWGRNRKLVECDSNLFSRLAMALLLHNGCCTVVFPGIKDVGICDLLRFISLYRVALAAVICGIFTVRWHF
jgi:hypothetical protein